MAVGAQVAETAVDSAAVARVVAAPDVATTARVAWEDSAETAEAEAAMEGTEGPWRRWR